MKIIGTGLLRMMRNVINMVQSTWVSFSEAEYSCNKTYNQISWAINPSYYIEGVGIRIFICVDSNIIKMKAAQNFSVHILHNSQASLMNQQNIIIYLYNLSCTLVKFIILSQRIQALPSNNSLEAIVAAAPMPISRQM